MKKHNYWLYGIFILALFLRFYRLANFGFWVDEAFSAEVARLGLKEIATFLYLHDNHPPLFYYLLWGWIHILNFLRLPANEIYLRLPFVIFSSCQVVVLYYLTEKIAGKTSAKIASFCLAISASAIILGGADVRMYSLLGLLSLLSVYFLYNYITSQKKSCFWAYIIFTILALYTHYTAILLFMAQEVYLMLFIKKIGFKRWLLINVYILLGYSAWLPVMIHHFTCHPFVLMQKTGYTGYPRIFFDVLLSYFHGESIHLKPWGIYYSVLLCLILSAILLNLRAKEDAFYSSGLLALVSIMPISIMTVAFCIPPYTLFSPRQTIFILPFYLLLWLKKYPHNLVKLLLIIYIGCNLFALSRWYYNPEYQKTSWPQVCNFLQTKTSQYDAIILQNDYQNFAFRYYYHGMQPVFYFKPATTNQELEIFEKKYRRLCFISCYGWVVDPQLKILKWLEHYYIPTKIVVFKNSLDPSGSTTIMLMQRP